MKNAKALLLAMAIAILVIGVLAYSIITPQISKQKLVLATTTSTYDSGLLTVLNRIFEEKYNVEVHVLPLGTGAALKAAERGEADVVLVHAPKLEEDFVKRGYGVNRTFVMFNYFVIVGPTNDPAGIKGLKNATEAFIKIANSNSLFVSRGDNSGTHNKELEIWRSAGVSPSGSWYIEAGAGMGQTLLLANEEGGYTLSDIGTYLAYKALQRIQLEIMVEEDPLLLNPYHVIAVSPEKFPERNYELALAYIEFLVSQEAQEIIAEYGKDYVVDPETGDTKPGLGRPLFYPRAALT